MHSIDLNELILKLQNTRSYFIILTIACYMNDNGNYYHYNL